MAAKRKPEPRRVRLTIPQADESALAWVDLQDDASGSMRALIRESIARDGYIDVINKPVGVPGSSADGPEPSVHMPATQTLQPAAGSPVTISEPAAWPGASGPDPVGAPDSPPPGAKPAVSASSAHSLPASVGGDG
ncbi:MULTISPECIES: hypothetical protein [Arthrobacter]|uniref:Uncharacterized protein n=1 Tax=Arthrobacter terricola TaxID=2547396 RepID=A0A4R5JZX3_9MICC|nr:MULTISPECIES: hypothetical protein [Arthrobacter]MBT8163792.1 hypothetical protein [Arthrobacter sp. GN70]TDF83535.1 hypothetical protein E1809_26215 [Arthrobacter terricola]